MKKGKFHKIIIFSLIVIIVLECFYLGYLLLKPKFRTNEFKESINIEYKDKYKNTPGKVCFGNVFTCNKATYKVNGKVNTKKLGKYKLKYTFSYNKDEINLTQTVNVVDKTAPKMTLETDKIAICPNGKIDDFKISVIDNYDGDITNKITKNYDEKTKKVIIKAVDSNKNSNIIRVDTTKGDKKAPVLKLKGNTDKYLNVGEQYKDEGVDASDNCDDNIKVEVKDEVDYNTPGTYNITYIAKDSSNNESKIQRKIHIKNPNNSNRVVYLTFDDGPSSYTGTLLDILKKYNVKVTFFVTGHGEDSMIKREFDEGHKIALHTNTHNYNYLYSSVDNYFEDLTAVQSRVERITGYKSNLIRFPGGSSNVVSDISMRYLTSEVEKRGFHYFDWNVSSGDGGGTQSTDQVYLNVIGNLKEEYSIVLQHDTQKFSVDAVERIIKYCLDNGYTFKTLDESSPTAHHGVNY